MASSGFRLSRLIETVQPLQSGSTGINPAIGSVDMYRGNPVIQGVPDIPDQPFPSPNHRSGHASEREGIRNPPA